ncbi:hypothetical protein O4214_30160 [Rhodococcus erythropolis]|uniref:hypothetical protein n=1 Tax=Rhodococcus erythropolis TaxID=1833 RepID=UPI001E5F0571|nr:MULTISPECIES: hypothetical protein [Rhodococcus erythropolis group]MCD2109330.1 hypothetical protein [Rhodococcus qingshengii]MCZ4528255.1 hypothetical protein [Rhodococcus erythropolis]
MELAEWLTLATLVATLITLYLVAVVELRHRRRYKRVEMVIDHIGQVAGNDGATFELFEVTNCGIETATRIDLVPVGCKQVSTTEIRPIRILSPGESKRFVVAPERDLADCWVSFAHFIASDYRYKVYTWEPLKHLGPLGDVQLADMVREDERGWIANRLRFKRSVDPVGPGKATRAEVRCWRGEKSLRDMQTANAPVMEWLEEWKETDAATVRS